MNDQMIPPRRRPASVPAAETPGLNGLLTLAVAVVVVAALFLAREVLIPITLAILLSFLLAPLVGLLRRLYLPRVPAVLLSVVLALGIIGALGGLIGLQVATLAEEMPRYQYTIESKLGAVRGFVTDRLAGVVSRVGQQLENASKAPPPAPAAPGAAPVDAAPQPVPVEVHQPNPTPMELAERVLAPILGPLSTTAIVFIVATFVLLQREDLRDRLIRLFGSADLHRTTVAMDDAAHRLSRYFLLNLAINVTFGVVIACGLFLIGIPSPVLWGGLGALLRFVPYIGAPLAAALPLMLAAAVDPGWSMVVWAAALYLVVEAVLGQVVEPMLYGQSTGLSPVSVVVAATFWTWLWGPIGLILSTPLTLCLVVLGRHVDRLEFLDVVLGDRPALTPVENFYQRMLAGDPDEAQDQAELLLRERALSSYYDEVALKGLQLAADDVQRGVLGPEQLEVVRTAATALIDELESADDAEPAHDVASEAKLDETAAERALPRHAAPAPERIEAHDLAETWRVSDAVLCVAGRGPFDEAASRMLAQLVAKRGIATRVVTHAAVSRDAIGSLDVAGARMICVSHVEITGGSSYLRYLLRRLRQRAPGARIMVGLWPAQDTVFSDPQLRAAIGADDYAASLRDAVAAVLAAATEAGENSSPARAA